MSKDPQAATENKENKPKPSILAKLNPFAFETSRDWIVINGYILIEVLNFFEESQLFKNLRMANFYQANIH
jgi:hypothetical protein